MATSQNGYSANDRSVITAWVIPGTARRVSLRKGDAGFLLVHFAAWFHKHVEAIDTGIYDDWGYAERPIRGSSRTLSNHASGTAIDLNATRHPLGKRGTFTERQAALIRQQLRVYDGCLRWGGDYRNRADEMHFEIDAPPARVAAVAAQLREDWFDMADKEDLREVLREELARLFGDDASTKGPDITKARIRRSTDQRIVNLGDVAGGIDALLKRKD